MIIIQVACALITARACWDLMEYARRVIDAR